MNLTTRLRSRWTQSWIAYGRTVSPSRELRHTIGHATRTRLSAQLVSAQLVGALRRPRDASLPSSLRDVVFALEGAGCPASAWLVHRRPNTGRTIVHEIDADGRLLSVVKIGDATDDGLAHEAAILAALGAQPPASGAVVAELVDFARDASRSALRTRLELTDLVAPPYAWRHGTLQVARRAARSLGQRLGQLPDAVVSDHAMRADEIGCTASHGDFVPWNLFLLKGAGVATFAVIDFESTARWPANWDATRLFVSACEEHRIARPDVASAAGVLGVTSDDVVAYLDVQAQSRAPALDAAERGRILNYAGLVHDAQ